MPITLKDPPTAAPAASGDWLNGPDTFEGDIPVGMLGKSPAQMLAPQEPPKDLTPVNVTGPDGKSYKLPSWQLPQAQAQGYRPETEDERLGRQFKGDHPIASAYSAYSRAFLEGATLGVVDGKMLGSIARALGASDRRVNELEASGKNEHAASTIGKIGGVAASLLTGAPLIEGGAAVAGGLGLARAAGETGLVARTLLSAGRGAIEVAALETPKAVRDVIRDEPDKAWESMAAGLGGGFLLGAAGPLLLKGVETGLDAAAGVAPKLDKFRQRQFLKSVASNEASLGKAEQDARFLSDKRTRAGGGEELGRWLDQEGREYAPKITESAENYAKRIDGSIDREIEGIANAKTKTGEKVSIDTGRWYTKMVEETLAKLDSPAEKEIREAVESQLQRWTDEWSTPVTDESGKVVERVWKDLPFDEAYQQFQKFSRLKVDFNTLNANANKIALRKMRSVWQNELFDQAIEQGAEETTAALKASNDKYAHLTAIQKAVDDNLYRLAKNATFSPTDKAAGFTTAAMLGLAHGAPGVAMGYGAAVGAKLVREHGNAILARVVPSGQSLKALQASMTLMGERFAQLPAALEGTLKIAPIPTAGKVLSDFSATRFDAFGHATNDSKPAKDPQAAFGQISKRITDLTSNPDHMASAMANMASHFSDNPDVATGLVAHNTAALVHLQKVMPKSAEVGNPLVKTNWQPSKSQYDEFAKRLLVVHDPSVVIPKIANKTLSPAEWDTLRTVWPAHTRNLMQGMMEYAISGNAKPVAYERLNQFQIATGVPITQAMKDLASYQAVYLNDQKAQQSAPKGGKKLKGPQAQTPAQSIEQR